MRWIYSSLFLLSLSLASMAKEGRPNVLFIAVDDLRPELGCYGASHIHSPNIDALAKSGVLFEKAYCSVPTCGASRASLMTGLRPTPSRFLSYKTIAEKDAPGVVTMNTHFKKHGYRTLSFGKVFHSPKDNEKGWSQKPWFSSKPGHQLPVNRKNEKKGVLRGAPWEIAEAPDENYQDGEIAAEAVKCLGDLAAKPDEPFFLAVGFKKPHLPFAAPKKYWDLYPLKSIQLPGNYRLPKNAPESARYSWGELRRYSGMPAKGEVTDDQGKFLIRGYYACVSFIDAQVGKVLAELKKQGLEENTIVILWGDHGWNLGDHTYWCKHTIYESSLQIPLIVKGPGCAVGGRVASPAESVDLYPTLCKMAGLPLPKTLEGESLHERLVTPASKVEDIAFSRYQRGDSIRFGTWRYSEYRDRQGKVIGRMLYDHAKDPLENENVVAQPQNKTKVRLLSERLKDEREKAKR